MKHHQMLKRSTIMVQPVLELTGVRCPTIPPGQLHQRRGGEVGKEMNINDSTTLPDPSYRNPDRFRSDGKCGKC